MLVRDMGQKQRKGTTAFSTPLKAVFAYPSSAPLCSYCSYYPFRDGTHKDFHNIQIWAWNECVGFDSIPMKSL